MWPPRSVQRFVVLLTGHPCGLFLLFSRIDPFFLNFFLNRFSLTFSLVLICSKYIYLKKKIKIKTYTLLLFRKTKFHHCETNFRTRNVTIGAYMSKACIRLLQEMYTCYVQKSILLYFITELSFLLPHALRYSYCYGIIYYWKLFLSSQYLFLSIIGTTFSVHFNVNHYVG